jgi:transcriptional regulator with XRE-family HTH domain
MKTPSEGRDWAKGWTAQVAANMLAARKRQGNMSAQALSDRCAELGYPIPRSTIQNLEIGRKESISVQEAVVLAQALMVPPILLLYPLGRAEGVEVLPGVDVSAWEAVQWFIGDRRLPLQTAGAADDLPEEWPIHYFRRQDRLLGEWNSVRQELRSARAQLGGLDWQTPTDRPDLAQQKLSEVEFLEQRLRSVEERLGFDRRTMRDLGVDLGDLPPELKHVDEIRS